MYLLIDNLSILEESNYSIFYAVFFRLDLPLLLVRIKRSFLNSIFSLFLYWGSLKKEPFMQAIGSTFLSLTKVIRGKSIFFINNSAYFFNLNFVVSNFSINKPLFLVS